MANSEDRPYAKIYKTSPKKPRLDLSLNGSENGDEKMDHDFLERPTMAAITNGIKPEAPKIFSCSICKERFASRFVKNIDL